MAKRETEAERTCIVTGGHAEKHALLRFVVSPAGQVVADMSAKLPGRGMWVLPHRNVLEHAIAKNLFSRAAKEKVTVPPDLAQMVEAKLRQHVLDALSMCRKAGVLISGFEKVKTALEKEKGVVLIHALDAGGDGVSKLGPLARNIQVIQIFSRDEMAQVTGVENPVHLTLTSGGAAENFLAKAARFAGFSEEHPL